MIFIAYKIREWSGRYARIEGGENVFHIRYFKNLDWWICIEKRLRDEIKIFLAAPNKNLNKLMTHLNHAKKLLNGQFGGEFIINEFGQVIVPSAKINGKRVLIGRLENIEKFYFFDIDNKAVFTLSDIRGMKLGSFWDKPYIGVPYNLSWKNEIYFWRKYEDYGYKEILQKKYDHLIKNLRNLRKKDSIRFIVNPCGVVLTKIQINGIWQPVFVQKIDYNQWFDKEE